MATAPLAPRIVEKGLPSDNEVIAAVVAKYCDHLPLYRQAVPRNRGCVANPVPTDQKEHFY